MILKQLLLLSTIMLTQSYVILLPHLGELTKSEAPIFKFDLDVEPYHRWDNIVPTFKEEIQHFVETIFDQIEYTDGELIEFGVFINNFYIYRYIVEEIQGIAIQAEVMWEKLFIINYLFEISTVPMCTSVLVKNIENKILHGRDLDFQFWKQMSRLTAKLEIYKDGIHIGTWDQIISTALVTSGLSNNEFSLTINTRYFEGTDDDVVENLFIKQYYPSAFLSRKVLIEEPNYQKAKETLMNTNVSSTIYYILGGLEDGIIIEKDPVGVHGFHDFNQTNPSDWFLVQTNYDWNQDPIYDERRLKLIEKLGKVGQKNIDQQKLFDLLTEYPNLTIMTIFTSVFSASYNYDDVGLWYGNVNQDEENKASQFIEKYAEQQEKEFQFLKTDLQKLINGITKGAFKKKIKQQFYPTS